MTAGDGQYEVLTGYSLQPGESAAGLKPMKLLLASLQRSMRRSIPR